SANKIIIEAEKPGEIFEAIEKCESVSPSPYSGITTEPRIPREEYLSILRKLQQHILRGDCYEINFCQEFFSNNAKIDPFFIYEKLSQVSPNPFSALYRVKDQWLICASPERFLKKEGDRVLSQPIKGTLKREGI